MPLRILLLEDNDEDADLIVRELRKRGLEFTVQRVETESDYRRQLLEFAPDLILSDYALPQYDGLSALAVAREVHPVTPFIFVTGTMGEETAIDTLHQGATDYVLKQRLGRLVPAVRRALLEVEERRQHERAEKGRREAEDRFRVLFEQSPDGIVILEPGTARIIEFNEAAHRQLGYSRDEFVRLTISDIEAVETPSDTRRRIQDVCRKGKEDFEIRQRTKQGKNRDVHVTAQIIEVAGQTVYHCIWRDITERKHAETRIRHLNDVLRAVQDVNGLIVRERNAERLLAEACTILVRTRGYRLVWIGRAESDSKRVFPAARAGERSDYLDTVTVMWDESDTGQGPIGTALRTRQTTVCQDTETDPRFAPWREEALSRGYRSVAAVPLIHGSRLFGAVNVYADRSEAFDDEELALLNELAADLAFGLQNIDDEHKHKQAEEALRKSEANLARAETFSHIMVVHLALDGRWLKVPPLLWQLLGYTEAELLASRIQDRMHPDDVAADWRECQRLLQSDLKTFTSDKRYRNKNGQSLWFETNVTLVLNAQSAPELFLVYLRDITESKQVEAQFLRSQRLENVGRLASGIAHDLNNILAPILMAVPMLREELMSEGNQRLLNTMESSALRGASIVKQVLAFGRGIEGQRAPLQLRHLLREMTQIIRETFPKSITLRVLCPHDLWTVNGDSTQLHQVLMNLCVNARDALPTGGALILAAGNVQLDDTFAGKVARLHPGPYVLLTVTDTGTGISPENLERIFEPFFTTKPTDQGTGLGLSTVFGIVKSHGGVVLVASTVGKGTQFSIYLPATDVTPLQLSDSEPGKMPRGNGELILVVDDEESIRAVTVRVLQAQGYRTLVAGDGAKAMILNASHGQEIQLVVTDLMMPTMDGIALVRALRQISPEVKIIVTSGLGSHPQSTEAATLDVDAFLLKPYTIASLLISVQDALHPRGA